MKLKLFSILSILSLIFVGMVWPIVPVKVACIGDSITAGVWVGDPVTESYPAVLGRQLGPGYVVRNFGVSGRTMLKKGDYPYWTEPQFAESSAWLPDIVVIMLGTNDSKPQNWLNRDEFVADCVEMINHYKNMASHPTVYVNTCPMTYNDGAWGITTTTIQAEVVPRIKEAARTAGCPVIDVNAATSGQPQNYPDNVHPSAGGAKVIAAAVGSALTAASTAASFQSRSFTSGKFGQAMPYRLFVPAGYEAQRAYPLVLFLHGAGERGSDNRAQLSANAGATVWAEPCHQAKNPCFVLAPQCPPGKKWVNTPWRKGSYRLEEVPASVELQTVLKIIAEVRKRYNIDAARIYVVGVSMGGYAVWDINLRYPHLFAAAVPICGAGDPSKAGLILAKPVWVFHGTADPLVPVAGSREMIAALRAAGGNPVYTEYSGVGHGSWVPALANPDLIEWVFSQRIRAEDGHKTR
jgi:poly(3-hydroxybutyrate) depolymerase